MKFNFPNQEIKPLVKWRADMLIDVTMLEEALTILGQLLADRGHNYEIAAIGGGGLLLLGLMERPTRDLDLVALVRDHELISANPLPPPLARAIDDVGAALELGNEWLNIGPASLLSQGLPVGFMSRLQPRYYRGLTVHLASRLDQIYFKLYASVDLGPESKHVTDLLALKPSPAELEQAKQWCLSHDTSDAFRTELNKALQYFYAQ
jgi:hypothetical protein